MMKEYKEESFLESNLRTACETAKNIILLGDFNINYFNKNDNLTEKLENICNTNNLSQQILKPTRMNVNTGNKTLIDHIWINQECVPVVKSAGTCLGLSDHLGTYIKINTRMESEEKKKRDLSALRRNSSPPLLHNSCVQVHTLDLSRYGLSEFCCQC